MSAFAIIGASGSVLASQNWTTTQDNAVQVAINERYRTYLNHKSDKPTYLISNGNDLDFVRLEDGHGFTIGPGDRLWFRSRIWHGSAASSRIIVLEYDKDRNRIGELSITVNNDARLYFRPETRYALLTIRVQGRGTIAFTELQAHLEDTDSAPTLEPGVQHFRLDSLQRQAQASPEDIQQQVAGIASIASNLSEQLSSNDDFPTLSSPDSEPPRLDSRHDGAISSARESLARELLISMAKSLPDSNGSHHFEKLKLSIGVIADESMFNFYKDSCEEVHYLSPSNYWDVLNNHSLDAVIYVTCWKGLEGDEWRGIKFREEPKHALEDILSYCKATRIPAVFQSIEDPSNFDYFLPVASKFDHVFTTDINCIEKYKAALEHENVYYGEYGANPIINNPIGSFRHNLPRALFSGSYPERYPERTRDMKMVFDSFEDAENTLTIIDRNFDSNDFEYPEKYQTSIIGPLPHDLLQKVHKLFRYSINFNSIKNSPTMCAMRIYELQAQGKPLISNYAKSVFNQFPEVRIVPYWTNLREIGDKDQRLEEVALAQRALIRIMVQKTSYHVVANAFKQIGLSGFLTSKPERVLVVAIGNSETVTTMVSRQRFVEADVVPQEVFRTHTIDLKQYGYVAAMSSEIEYEDYYLAGRKAAFIHARPEFVTQRARFDGPDFTSGPIHEFTDKTTESTLTMVPVEHEEGIEFLKGRLTELEGLGYAVDPYEVNFSKHLKATQGKDSIESSRLTIVIPVHNNGEYLLSKCLPSIQRHDGWDSFNILLIDDGSSDDRTRLILRDLERVYSNVRLIEYSDNGSGSASRPRNRGILETTTEFITFLDPDNEVSDNGYNALLRYHDQLSAADSQVDFISGFEVKVSGDSRVNGLHTDQPLQIVENPVAEFFATGRFPVVSSQAAVIRTNFLRTNSIDFVEKAAGQDTLFGWELLAKARKAAFSNQVHIVYYAERDGSVTNEVDASYFQKSLTLEREQVNRLAQMGLLELYKEHHLDQFYRNWYLNRLELVSPTDYAEARKKLSEIMWLYGKAIEEHD
jgi:glycosyltransferase involved in cell wall biosynthesis